MGLYERSIKSIKWIAFSNVIINITLLVRSIFLARLLPVNIFGIYALALAIVGISIRIPRFGMDGAFINRAPETEDVDATAAVHFSLTMTFTIIWAIILLFGSHVLTNGILRTSLVV